MISPATPPVGMVCPIIDLTEPITARLALGRTEHAGKGGPLGLSHPTGVAVPLGLEQANQTRFGGVQTGRLPSACRTARSLAVGLGIEQAPQPCRRWPHRCHG